MPSVSQHIAGLFNGEGTPVVFEYDSDDPLAVTLYFVEYDSIWTIARELFVDAVTIGTAGVGDVKVTVFLNETTLLLRPAGVEEAAVVKFRTTDINNFMELTNGIVKHGAEAFPDIDDVIARILREAS